MTIDLPAILRLATEAKARAEAAWPGPWCVHPNGTSIWTGSDYDSNDETQMHVCNTANVRVLDLYNMDFIAESRTDIPALCEAVEKMAGELARVRAETIEECAKAIENDWQANRMIRSSFATLLRRLASAKPVSNGCTTKSMDEWLDECDAKLAGKGEGE